MVRPAGGRKFKRDKEQENALPQTRQESLVSPKVLTVHRWSIPNRKVYGKQLTEIYGA